MEHEPDNSVVGETTAPEQDASSGWVRRLGRSGRFRVGVGVLLGVIVLLGAFDVVTASPRLCASCHEMGPRSETWSRSAHSTVLCVQCHQSPRSLAETPLRLLDRGRLLGRDVVAHIGGEYENPVDSRIPGTDPISDAVCLQCHDPNRKATSGFRILIDHVEHAKRNGSCISCHVRTAHPLEARGNALSLMAQCYTCHGTTATPEASAECDTCHPSGYELKPVSHEPAAWKRGHSEVALSDPRQCEMCHDKEFCTSCHGIEMPHPEGWAEGKTGHAGAASLNRKTCGRCHGDRPDMCTMCHHTGYEPAKGTWAKQHFIEVRKRGTVFCLGCHSPVYCARCHTN